LAPIDGAVLLLSELNDQSAGFIHVTTVPRWKPAGKTPVFGAEDRHQGSKTPRQNDDRTGNRLPVGSVEEV
jgi:hypothetical protein